MGANTPAAGKETKPVVKHEGKPSHYGVIIMQTETTTIIPKINSLEQTRTSAGRYLRASAIDQNRWPISKLTTTLSRRSWGLSKILLS